MAELMGVRKECGGYRRERQENDSDRPGIFLSVSEETAAGTSVDSFLLCLSGHTVGGLRGASGSRSEGWAALDGWGDFEQARQGGE